MSLDDLAFLYTLNGPQSIQVIECPEFQNLSMLLHENLVDNKISRHNKMRKEVICKWWDTFEQLKLELSVSITVFLSVMLTVFSDRNLAGRLVSLQIPGQTQPRVLLSVDCSLDLT